MSKKHNLLPLIFEKASEDNNFVGLPVYQRLALETMSIVAGQARRTEAFISLYSKFVNEDIHPIVIKGIICRQLYGDLCDHRPSSDEDILVKNQSLHL